MDAVDVRVRDRDVGVLKQKQVDGVSGNRALNRAEQRAPRARIGRELEPRQQRFVVRIGIAEVVVVASVDVVIQRLGVSDDGQIEIVRAEDLREPGHPVDGDQLHAHAGLGQFGGDDFGRAFGVAQRRHREGRGEAARVPGLRE